MLIAFSSVLYVNLKVYEGDKNENIEEIKNSRTYSFNT
jgi:hypothetical protein